MYYKRTKVVETVFFDGEITNIEEIRSIIESLHRHEFDVALRTKGDMIVHPRARIVSTGENSFKYSIIGKGSSLIKQAYYTDIESLYVSSNDLYSAQTKPEISRWSLLNPASEFDS